MNTLFIIIYLYQITPEDLSNIFNFRYQTSKISKEGLMFPYDTQGGLISQREIRYPDGCRPFVPVRRPSSEGFEEWGPHPGDRTFVEG